MPLPCAILTAAVARCWKRERWWRSGRGLGQEPEAQQFALRLIELCGGEKPIAMVLDADCLNAIAQHGYKLDGRGRTIVLTPHPGEMARLVGKTIPEVEADREGIARAYATEHQVTLVLKGWRTLIAHPDGGMAVNTTGNPGLAKGGSGDILTGITAAMLAQYKEHPAQAVEAAVYLHGLAADFAVIEHDEHTLLATEVCAYTGPRLPLQAHPGRWNHLAARVAGYAGAQNAEVVRTQDTGTAEHRTAEHKDT